VMIGAVDNLLRSVRSQGQNGVWVIGIAVEDVKSYVARLPLEGETLLSLKASTRDWGGKGANQAVQAALICQHQTTPPQKVHLVANLGGDSRGAEMCSHFESSCGGLNTDFVTLDKGAETGTSQTVYCHCGIDLVLFLIPTCQSFKQIPRVGVHPSGQKRQQLHCRQPGGESKLEPTPCRACK